jgi:hypothetical protein
MRKALYKSLAPGTPFMRIGDQEMGIKSVYSLAPGDTMAISMKTGAFWTVYPDEEVQLLKVKKK